MQHQDAVALVWGSAPIHFATNLFGPVWAYSKPISMIKICS